MGERPYFNSRPSARGDLSAELPCFNHPISIHAPPRGATRRGEALALDIDISIHAPPRGATVAGAFRNRHLLFQFTPLREGRRRWYAVSLIPSVFQFTPLREGRPLDIGEVGGEDVFQFTPLREGRHARRKPHDFHVAISIHAPPRGATGIMRLVKHGKNVFQFTPLREGRRMHCKAIQFLLNFNSRPSARGDKGKDAQWVSVPISIHAPPRGATEILLALRLSNGLFQFTPLREGRRRLKHLRHERGLFQFTPLREGRLTAKIRDSVAD